MQHWVVCFARDLQAGAVEWVKTMKARGKSYTLLSGYGTTAGQLAGVQADDVVYVFSHGYYNRQNVPTGQIMLDHAPIDATALSAALKDQGLPNDRVLDLKVFACFTDDDSTINSESFAMLLRRAMCKDGYHLAVVYGYKGQTSANVFDGHKSANVAIGSKGGEDKIPYRVTRNTTPDKVRELLDNWTHRASDHRSAYYCPSDPQFCPFT